MHDDATAGHKGYDRTIQLFVRNMFNKRETKFIKDYCEACTLCTKAKAAPKVTPLKKYPIPRRPFEAISSDLLGPLPITEDENRYVIVVKDFTTRYCVILPLKDKETESILNALRTVIAHYGPSKILLTDNAKEYTSEKMTQFCRFFNIQKVQITPFHSSSQGLSERLNRTVNQLLRIYTHQLAVNDWDQLLPTLQLTINNTYNASLGETPFYALYGYDSPTITLTQPKLNYNESDLSYRLKRVTAIRNYCHEHLLKMQEQYTNRTNLNRKDKPIEIGDRVFAKLNKHQVLRKLDLPIAGPFVVTEKKGSRLTIQAVDTHDTFHIHPDSIITKSSFPMNENMKKIELVKPVEKPKTKYNLRPRN